VVFYHYVSFIIQLFASPVVNFLVLVPLKVSMFLSLDFPKLTTSLRKPSKTVFCSYMSQVLTVPFVFPGTVLGLQFMLLLSRPSAPLVSETQLSVSPELDPVSCTLPFLAWFISSFQNSTSSMSILRIG
jgi:hypothetical protein